ncbi:RidA family protein [Hoeflea alexandrii]|uniref:RidA family protein n=1 Tax=Hoeflea alexandrii TaxID=288436 RepID=UPI0022AFA85A|nr:RidA family protein [Hoeflea alexandrii]MCZ4287633.1 RidA family protein [Hoeflea alexandrii]
MQKEIIRVEPIATFAERRGVKVPAAVRHDGLVFVSNLPPYDFETGAILEAPLARQVEVVIKQMRLCLEAAGSSMDDILRCGLYIDDPAHFQTVETIYNQHFPDNPPARTLLFGSQWHGPFHVEIDCIASVS